ncbi:MAG: hypothetical protein KDC05_01955 [Bacteroidales bacterium]|nr:hypothetical protein [Bacteroidales bacterium]
MKKLSYLLGLLVFAGVIFTSCSDDDDDEPQNLKPTVTFQTGTGYTSSDVEIMAGDSIKIGVVANENSNSGANLTNIRIYMIVANVPQNDIFNEDINESSYSGDFTITFPDVVEGTLYVEVTDKDGEKNNASFKVTVNPNTTELGAATDLEWKRVGGAVATGLDMFGLKWTSNGKKTDAQITKDGADKFVMLEPADWTDLATVEGLMEAISAGTDMEEYTGISATASGDYDEVLGVLYNETYYLIHLTHAEVVVETSGTTITIDGQYKM